MGDTERGGNQNQDPANIESIDLRTIDEGRYIFPSPAEGANIIILKSENFEIPVSITVQDKRFRLNGMDKKTAKGFVVSGIHSEEAIKINHIVVDEELRRTGLSQAVLKYLESEMKKEGVKVVYASFSNQLTIDFFLKNGYEIFSYNVLSPENKKSLLIDKKAVDQRVNSTEDYEDLKSSNAKNFRKILLRHNI